MLRRCHACLGASTHMAAMGLWRPPVGPDGLCTPGPGVPGLCHMSSAAVRLVVELVQPDCLPAPVYAGSCCWMNSVVYTRISYSHPVGF